MKIKVFSNMASSKCSIKAALAHSKNGIFSAWE